MVSKKSSIAYGFDFVSSSSRAEHHAEDKAALLERTRRQREERQLQQRKENSARTIQHAIRREIAAKHVQERLRQKFDVLWNEYCNALPTTPSTNHQPDNA